ncbi:MAG: glycosyltransferase family 2 protein [Pseudomonadota bacterium]
MSHVPSWGVVATIRATAKDILNFAAHHLDLGAHRVFVYLDEDEPEARSALKRHPKCRVILTDDAYWRRRRKERGRPDGHQHRQVVNATHCYQRDPQVDWLLHADVDEFLLPGVSLQSQLAALAPTTGSARVRPMEALQSDPDDPPPDGQLWCKSFDVPLRARRERTIRTYPTFGTHLNGGFVSHVAGKILVRTGRENIVIRIHNAFVNNEKDTTLADLPDCKLIHLHAPSWEDWQSRYRYRLERGSYRPDLKGAAGYCSAAMTMHDLFSMLEQRGGLTALQEFYQEVCVATPALRTRLDRYGNLHAVTLDLDSKRARHFPKAA